jgi:hypothetical protein
MRPKGYLADPRADAKVAGPLAKAWEIRKALVAAAGDLGEGDGDDGRSRGSPRKWRCWRPSAP